MGYTDQDILLAIKSGNSESVLTHLYKVAKPKVKSLVLQNNGDEDEAQDIFQDAVVAFYKYVLAGQFKEGNSVTGFIYSISRNLWINRAKQKNRLVGNIENHTDVQFDGADAYTQTVSKERALKIQEILAMLGERCKELLTYSIFNKMSMEDISQKMGFSNADTAKTKNYKCKQRLIQLVKENQHLKEFLYS
ncbi:MAG: sigma-70 family RNA polymerase sigma factor [Bacteroidetes bacterium]|nr:sigma-70 family RNA polymerase sigma factor [Bacteroidota bacterium]